MISAIPQKPRQAVVEVLDFMCKRGLTPDDLIEVGGEVKSSNPKRVEKARRVEKCWSLMARLSIKFADLEAAPQSTPDKPTARRRGEGHFSEALENTRVSETFTHHTKPNEINGLADSAPVSDPQLNPGTDGMSLDHACQSGRHPHAEHGADLYAIPPIAVEALPAVKEAR
jgi:hypothetical protein